MSPVTQTYETYSQDQVGAPRINNEPLDPRFPGYFRLPGTETLLRIGGYAKTDFIYDLKPAGNADSFIPATIPIPAPAAFNNSTISVRPTRINLDFLVPTKSGDSYRFFLEMDFFGTNATTPRLRQAYGQAKNFLIGQTFSDFMDPDAGPDQLDFQGPNAQVSIRTPQFRYSLLVANKTTFSFAAEKPTSDVAFTTPQFTALPNSPAPDGTLKLRREMDRGHVQLSVVLRSVAAYLPDGLHGAVFGWGFNLAGAERLWGNDTVVYQVAYGNGIESGISTILPGSALMPGVSRACSRTHISKLCRSWQHTERIAAFLASAIGVPASSTASSRVQNTQKLRAGFHISPGVKLHSGGNLIWNPFWLTPLSGGEFL